MKRDGIPPETLIIRRLQNHALVDQGINNHLVTSSFHRLFLGTFFHFNHNLHHNSFLKT